MNRTFFVTSVTAQRRTLFQHDGPADLFVEVLLHYRNQGKYLLHEFVVMPDHFHVLITPHYDVSLEKAVQFIKGGFSFRLSRTSQCGKRVLQIIAFATNRISKGTGNTFA